ncbi:MAG: N-acetylglucosamine-6-phosphate deacetylase [Snowella sp.]|nr:N-acetylglucosamine-6-phosphate deacetylase [Snowella sp.]
MLNNIQLINVRLPNTPDLQQLYINAQGQIEFIIPQQVDVSGQSTEQVLDLAGDWLSLGGVDLQINGALGLAFPDLEASDFPLLQKISQFLWEQGVDAYLPTIVTTSIKKIQRSLAIIDSFIKWQQKHPESGAKILGVHLEGPFLNPEKRGAHPIEELLQPTLKTVNQVLGSYGDRVKIITLAPELDPSNTLIPYLTSLGITVSLGHSQATEAQAQKAFELGASMVTHAFNAMPPLHHRHPGLLGAAICNPDVYCGFIADGQHVSPTMLDILLRASYYEKGAFLVSDALAPLGLSDGIYPWDDRQMEVKQGTARLADGTLSGTTLPQLEGVVNLLSWGICSTESAIALATEAPRRAIKLSGLSVGQTATLLRWQVDPVTQQLKPQRLSP